MNKDFSINFAAKLLYDLVFAYVQFLFNWILNDLWRLVVSSTLFGRAILPSID